ncbi:flagellar protein FlaG [Jeotgalibacillus sp. ET6]|uniref:flagellar protein FlaG n=1 Tax=Jeotgalibacillus sp. ET6 TaxID=3037260 RepID=UPI0024183C53|nr:flagellar protein FlaG [Jeotgalibacillus sp. ET6]MDG5471613.1 flagellar protein FlaG [Jeotgalibacillus sp. ET6]
MEKVMSSLTTREIASQSLPQNAPKVNEGKESSAKEVVELNHGPGFASRIDTTKVDKIVKSMNEFLAASPTPTHIKFEFHEGLKEYYVTVVDEMTKEIVREIPAKRMLDMHASMTEFLGLLVDKKI